MAIDKYLSTIEELEESGATVILKWDGERTSNRRTVIVTRHDSDYSFRQDSDDVEELLQRALADYRATFE